jgi:hypothetical protein
MRPSNCGIAGWTATIAGASLLITAASAPAQAHDVDYVWPGYGGFTLYHNFNLDKWERPYHRHYYPTRWGGYSFSAPYYVSRHDYERPTYHKLYYGKRQKLRWLKENRSIEYGDWRRW